jgi:transposase InsO family protein
VNVLAAARKAFPFRITHVLTDRGSCFTADDFERAGTKLKVTRRMTKPYTPQTNGMVERFNGRIASEVLGINVAGHADLETLPIGFNHAYSRRQQRVLSGLSPLDTVRQRLEHNRRLANPRYKPADNNELLPKVNQIRYYANDVSQPDNQSQNALVKHFKRGLHHMCRMRNPLIDINIIEFYFF